jgi:hypothetical protein
VLLKIIFRRGKSEIPESRIEMEESRRESEERRDVTEAPSDWEDGVVIFLVDWVYEAASIQLMQESRGNHIGGRHPCFDPIST